MLQNSGVTSFSSKGWRVYKNQFSFLWWSWFIQQNWGPSQFLIPPATGRPFFGAAVRECREWRDDLRESQKYLKVRKDNLPVKHLYYSISMYPMYHVKPLHHLGPNPTIDGSAILSMPNFSQQIPSLKLTVCTWKWMVGIPIIPQFSAVAEGSRILISFGDGPKFSSYVSFRECIFLANLSMFSPFHGSFLGAPFGRALCATCHAILATLWAFWSGGEDEDARARAMNGTGGTVFKIILKSYKTIKHH